MLPVASVKTINKLALADITLAGHPRGIPASASDGSFFAIQPDQDATTNVNTPLTEDARYGIVLVIPPGSAGTPDLQTEACCQAKGPAGWEMLDRHLRPQEELSCSLTLHIII